MTKVKIFIWKYGKTVKFSIEILNIREIYCFILSPRYVLENPK